MTKVVNIRFEPYDVLIDRTTPWGNPFRIGIDGNRELVCKKHGMWLEDYLFYGDETIIDGFSNRYVIENLYQLKSKTLGCWCVPKKCHGDFLVRLLERISLKH